MGCLTKSLAQPFDTGQAQREHAARFVDALRCGMSQGPDGRMGNDNVRASIYQYAAREANK